MDIRNKQVNHHSRHWIKLLIFMVVLVCLPGCSIQNHSSSFYAQQGKLDLRNWSFPANEFIYLTGGWELYWNQLLDRAQILALDPDLISEVPGLWSEQSLPKQGYATYRLEVSTSLPKGSLLGLRIYPFASAYALFINDDLIARNGVVAMEAEEERGAYQSETVFFSIPDSTFDMIIHVSNYHYDDGGFLYHIAMGSDESILLYHEKYALLEAFLHGSFFILVILFMTVFLLRKELKYALFFSFLCLSMSFVLDTVGQYHLGRFFPGLGLKSFLTLWYSSVIWLVFFLILYVHRLYTTKTLRLITLICFVIVVGVQLFIFLSSSRLVTKMKIIVDLFAIFGTICAVLIIAIGIRNGKRDGWLNLISMLIVLVTYVHDILYWANVFTHPFGELVYIGIFLFLVIQMILQAKRIQYFHIQKREAELNFLQAQIKPHFIYNALNTIIYVCSSGDMKLTKKLLVDFSQYLRRSFDFKTVNQVLPLKRELELARAYVSLESCRFEERLQVDFECSDQLLEYRVPGLVLQPILENAIVHGILPKPEGGQIFVSIHKDKNNLIFAVEDNGVGFQEGNAKLSIGNSNRKGIGLTNIHARLMNLYGKGIRIESLPNVKTVVSWEIPLGKKSTKSG